MLSSSTLYIIFKLFINNSNKRVSLNCIPSTKNKSKVFISLNSGLSCFIPTSSGEIKKGSNKEFNSILLDINCLIVGWVITPKEPRFIGKPEIK